MSEYGCKVCRVLDERDIDRLDRRLVERWRGDDGERLGYRRLATWLNVTLVRREMERAGLPTVGNEARSRYDRLTGDDPDVRAEVRRLLRTAGVPVEGLERDFVSYGVVRTHLRECLDAERDPDEPADWEADAVAYAREEATERVGAAVRSLARKDRLSVGDPAVSVTVRVRCGRCGASRPASDAVRSGVVCECERE